MPPCKITESGVKLVAFAALKRSGSASRQRAAASATALIVAFFFPSSSLAQADSPAGYHGFYLRSLWLYAGHYSFDPTERLNSRAVLTSLYSGGIGSALGWSHRRERTLVFVDYSADYNANARYSAFNSLSQLLSLGASRRVRPRWGIQFSGQAESTRLTSRLFRSRRALQVLESSKGAEDLALAIASGPQRTLPDPNVVTTKVSTLAPEHVLLVGSDLRSGAVSMNATYSKSPRLSWYFGAGAAQLYYRYPPTQAFADTSLLARTRTASVYVGSGYSLSPRIQTGFDLETSQTFSNQQDYLMNRASFNITRLMTPRWFLGGQAGLGVISALRKNTEAPNGIEYIAGASAGYKTLSHAVLLSILRTLGDQYGFGYSSETTSAAHWTWQRPGGAWGISSSLVSEHLRGPARRPLDAWLALLAVTRRLSRHTLASADFAYSTALGVPIGGIVAARAPGAVIDTLARSAIRLSIIYTPGTRRRL